MELEPYLNVSVLSLHFQSKIRLAALTILHLTEATGQKKDHDVGDPSGKARAWCGTHCKKGFHRLVLEVGRWCRGQLAGSPHCTVSGRRLPWPGRAGWAGRVGKVWMEREKIQSPILAQYLFPLIFLWIFTLSRAETTYMFIKSHFIFLFLGTRKILFLVCLAVRFHHVTRFCPIECISLSQFWPIKPSAETLLPSLLLRQQLSRLKWQSYSMDYLPDPASACRGQLPWGVLFSPH